MAKKKKGKGSPKVGVPKVQSPGVSGKGGYKTAYGRKVRKSVAEGGTEYLMPPERKGKINKLTESEKKDRTLSDYTRSVGKSFSRKPGLGRKR